MFAQLARAYMVFCALGFIMWELWFLLIAPFVKDSHQVMMAMPSWLGFVMFPAFLLVALTMPINGLFLVPEPKWTPVDLAGMLVLNLFLLVAATASIYLLMRDPRPWITRIENLIKKNSRKNLKYAVNAEGIAQIEPGRATQISWDRLNEIQVVFDLEGDRAETHYMFSDKKGTTLVVHGTDYVEQGLEEELKKFLPKFKAEGVPNASGAKTLWKRSW